MLREAAVELARERGDVVLVRVDGDAQPQLRSRLQVAEAPSVLLFARGSQRDADQPERFTGALNRAALLGWARGALPPVSEPPAAAGRAAQAAQTSPPAPPRTDDGRENARAQQTADADEVAARLLDVLRAGGGARDEGDAALRSLDERLIALLAERATVRDQQRAAARQGDERSARDEDTIAVGVRAGGSAQQQRRHPVKALGQATAPPAESAQAAAATTETSKSMDRRGGAAAAGRAATPSATRRSREQRARKPAETAPARGAGLSLEEELDALLPPDDYSLEGIEQLMRDPPEPTPEPAPTRASARAERETKAASTLTSGRGGEDVGESGLPDHVAAELDRLLDDAQGVPELDGILRDGGGGRPMTLEEELDELLGPDDLDGPPIDLALLESIFKDHEPLPEIEPQPPSKARAARVPPPPHAQDGVPGGQAAREKRKSGKAGRRKQRAESTGGAVPAGPSKGSDARDQRAKQAVPPPPSSRAARARRAQRTTAEDDDDEDSWYVK